MSSVVEICNFALGLTGSRAVIAAIDENSKEAYHCNLHYESARDAALRARPWRFAKKYQVLADVGSPPSPWLYRYRYPADCLKARHIQKATTED